MKRSSEFKVGLTLLVTAVLVFFGTRFLENRPLFGRGYELVALFDDAQGVSPGASVLMSGVRIGTVEAVELGASVQQVLIRLRIDPDVAVPLGSTAATGGIAALGPGAVMLQIVPAPGGRALAPGDTLRPSPNPQDPINQITSRATQTFEQADTLVAALTETTRALHTLLTSPSSDFRGALAEARFTLHAVNTVLESERERLGSTLANLEQASQGTITLTNELNRFATENTDSLQLAIQRLNMSLLQAQTSLARVDSTIVLLNSPTGTAGLLLNDPTLYYNLNAASATLNQLLLDFQADPKRYLRELNLVKVF